ATPDPRRNRLDRAGLTRRRPRRLLRRRQARLPGRPRRRRRLPAADGRARDRGAARVADQRGPRRGLRDHGLEAARRRALQPGGHRPRRGLADDEQGGRPRPRGGTDRRPGRGPLRRWPAGLHRGGLVRAEIAIVGAAESDLGKVADDLTPEDLMAQASLRALAECGLGAEDVDGLFAASTQLNWASISLGEALGIRPRYSDPPTPGGPSPPAHLPHARCAIAAGDCEVALIAHGSTQRSVGRATASVQEREPTEEPYDPTLAAASYALHAPR